MADPTASGSAGRQERPFLSTPAWAAPAVVILLLIVILSGQWQALVTLVLVPLLSEAVQETAKQAVRTVLGCRTCEA
ncbi:hypothetical protein [Halostreptopolyspora alba]|uniref:hypothetical protein n=1 Tax=Halostreptopolyspora alba TaxID=2487137 RepID=UPI002695D53C